MRRGEIWWANLPRPWGRRPVLLVARDRAYELLTWVMVAPITTRRLHLPTAVLLDPRADGVERPSVAVLDNVMASRVEWLERFVTTLRPQKMQEVEQAIRVAFALPEAAAYAEGGVLPQ